LTSTVENPGSHTTVLLDEAVDALLTRADGIYVDGTFGRGGHTRALLARLGAHARVLNFDKDPAAIAAASEGATRIDDERFEIIHASFAELPAALAARGIARIDGLLLDLGVSSPQIDTPERGFSFRFDGPLDMRMDTTRGETAAEFLARADERQIAEVIRDYGEERFAVSIAKALVAGREGGHPVRTTGELSALVARAVKTREPGQIQMTAIGWMHLGIVLLVFAGVVLFFLRRMILPASKEGPHGESIGVGNGDYSGYDSYGGHSHDGGGHGGGH